MDWDSFDCVRLFVLWYQLFGSSLIWNALLTLPIGTVHRPNAEKWTHLPLNCYQSHILFKISNFTCANLSSWSTIQIIITARPFLPIQRTTKFIWFNKLYMLSILSARVNNYLVFVVTNTTAYSLLRKCTRATSTYGTTAPLITNQVESCLTLFVFAF